MPRRHSFQAKLALGICVLVVSLMVSIMTTISFSTTRAATGKIEGGLLAAQQVFEQFQQLRFQHLSTVNSMLVDVPQLKAVITTPGLDHATILDSARAAQQLIESDLLLLVDGQGTLLASVTEPMREGEDLSTTPAFASALRGASFAGIWVAGGQIYQVVTNPVLFGHEVVGAVLSGFALDSRVVEIMERMTNCQVALLGPETMVMSAAGAELFAKLSQELPVSGEASQHRMLTTTVSGQRYVVLMAPFGGSASSVLVSSFLVRSLDQELLFYRRLQRRLLIMAGAILLAALLGGMFFSRRITKPIRALMNSATRIAAGEFGAQVAVTSGDELGKLATVFNRMSQKLVDVLQREKASAATVAAAEAERNQVEALQRLNEHLTREVAERKEAEDTLRREREQLQRMNQIMIDREERILTLKQEVNALLEEFGRPPKYRS